MVASKRLVPDGSAIAKALDYSLKRGMPLTIYLDDGVPSITIGARIRPGHGLLGVRTDCLQACYIVAIVRLRMSLINTARLKPFQLVDSQQHVYRPG